MFRSCSYCGGVHKSNEDCPYKSKARIKINDKFRSGKQWQKKREQIKLRDNYMCQVCVRQLYGTDIQFNYYNTSVHHIQPLHSNYDLRLEDDNLICLCDKHHRMAECGKIPISVLKKIVQEQEDKVL